MLNRKVLIMGRFEDFLGVFDKGIWAICSCLTQGCLRVTLGRQSK